MPAKGVIREVVYRGEVCNVYECVVCKVEVPPGDVCRCCHFHNFPHCPLHHDITLAIDTISRGGEDYDPDAT